MVLVAAVIVIMLVALAVPTYINFQRGAKHSEVTTNLNGIGLTQKVRSRAIPSG